MKIRARAALPAIGVLAAAALPATSHADLSAEASTAGQPHRLCARTFDRAVDAYVQTTYDRDSDGFAAVLHEDVTAIFATGDVLYGKDQTMDFIDRFFAAPDWTQTFDELTREVRGCSTGFVLFDSVYTPAPDADPEPLVIGVTFVFERGRWLALHNQDSTGPAIGTP
ncbi:YybH family protein [Jiangella alkaliphila]|uniref:SnoaL-like domain-containing protein n=1 Tax=Jiangella alkaliphila TaxID=419479 RepID=A0A1H2HT71_9ACTN|nr:nuclear transport factor 2 family protein [Jiangella alkaliphila]SDU35014.1 SnoaL-like domain-containing protein [Jiangella alkaliphila]